MEIEKENSFATIQTENDLDRNNNLTPDNIGQANDSGSNELENPQNLEMVKERPQNPKFKSYDSLEKAYDALQAEFTRKSQELSDLKKSLDADKEKNASPAFMRDDWDTTVSNFFEKYPDARKFKNEISNLIVENDEIKNDSRPLDKALISILFSKALAPQELIEDDEFRERYIFSNHAIKDKIISDYVESLAKKATPPLISKSFASSLGTEKVEQPKTLKQVKELVAKMFQ